MSFERFLRPGVATAQAYTIADLDPAAVRLKDNENPFSLPPAVQERLLAPLHGMSFNRYPDSLRALREKIAAKHNWPVAGVALGNGSDELILLLLLTFGRGPVVVHRPTFVMYEHIARVLDRPVTVLDLEPETWDIPATTAEAAKNAALTFLATPNSPTGNSYSRERLEATLRAAAGLVVIDEAYADYSGGTCRDLLDRYPNAVMLRTFSKIGLAGLRLGYLLAPPAVIGYLDRVRLPYNVNAAVAAIACAFLDTVDISTLVAPVVAERARLQDALRGLGLTVYPSAANLLFCRHPRMLELTEKLRSDNVWIRHFGGALAEYARISIGSPDENTRFLASLRKII